MKHNKQDLQNTTQKTNDEATRITLHIVIWRRLHKFA
jgi:hypothetical protein